MKILVDADACPRSVLKICLKIGRRYAVPVWTIASFNHNIVSDYHIMVGNAAQETDLKLINLTTAGDVIVTQDWGLAAMVLAKGARCLSPLGREYDPEKIDFMLEERQIKAKLRRAGGRTKGPAKRNAEDDRRFEHKLETCLTALVENP
ncbi:MAG: DUF188 domain-containing protein [Heliobacteriaceae bacterium]|nr:DUF188 domain-containing protein [Heliobacteriaceae bacterium]MDD4588565.1 DUF188 domain-containing protein [Heliobacteriaceae bacterium]